MEFYIDFPERVIERALMSLVLLIVIFLAYRIYKQQKDRVKLWKIVIIIFIGTCPLNFNIDFNLFGFTEIIKIAILPLGVWLLYFIWRNNAVKWQKYRKYAWLGFLSNYFILGAMIITALLQFLIYPVDRPSTYFKDMSEAELLIIHPSAEQSVLIDATQLEEQLAYMREAKINGHQWYLDIHDMKVNEQEVIEKFPYMLVGVKGKWGSGYDSLIYVENDGKGLLITNDNKQYYYRFEQSVVTEVKRDNAA